MKSSSNRSRLPENMEVTGVCSICGRVGKVYTCMLCGRLVCSNCITLQGACVGCMHGRT